MVGGSSSTVVGGGQAPPPPHVPSTASGCASITGKRPPITAGAWVGERLGIVHEEGADDGAVVGTTGVGTGDGLCVCTPSSSASACASAATFAILAADDPSSTRESPLPIRLAAASLRLPVTTPATTSATAASDMPAARRPARRLCRGVGEEDDGWFGAERDGWEIWYAPGVEGEEEEHASVVATPPYDGTSCA